MTTAFINLWGKRVGAVAWDNETRVASFEYEPSFLDYNWNIAPLTMPIEQARIFSFPELRDVNAFKGLPGLLADALPDKYGNALINNWLIKNNRPTASMNPIEMLCFIGKRGMGALEFEPTNPKGNDSATKIEISSLVEIASEILNNRMSFSSQLNDDEKALMDILKIGASAGGARAKALITYNEQTREVRSGQADAPKGFEHWLIKFDGVHDSQFGEAYGYGRVEMAYYLMATDAEIEMMESRILEENGRGHFMTKRFDRIPGKGKIHVQTWCGLTHRDFADISSYSYEELFETMRMLRLEYIEAEQLFRRMVFNVIARNCDDHTKNFAFIMGKDSNWKLSPAYDICHAYRPDSPWVSRHCLSINGKRENITAQDLITVATSMNIKKPQSIISHIQSVVDHWETYADRSGVDSRLRNAIKSTLLKL